MHALAEPEVAEAFAPMSKVSGSVNWRSSRLAAPGTRTTRPPAGMVTPCSVTSVEVVPARQLQRGGDAERLLDRGRDQRWVRKQQRRAAQGSREGA